MEETLAVVSGMESMATEKFARTELVMGWERRSLLLSRRCGLSWLLVEVLECTGNRLDTLGAEALDIVAGLLNLSFCLLNTSDDFSEDTAKDIAAFGVESIRIRSDCGGGMEDKL